TPALKPSAERITRSGSDRKYAREGIAVLYSGIPSNGESPPPTSRKRRTRLPVTPPPGRRRRGSWLRCFRFHRGSTAAEAWNSRWVGAVYFRISPCRSSNIGDICDWTIKRLYSVRSNCPELPCATRL